MNFACLLILWGVKVAAWDVKQKHLSEWRYISQYSCVKL